MLMSSQDSNIIGGI